MNPVKYFSKPCKGFYMRGMTPRQRALAAIRHEEPDRVPFDITICFEPFMNLVQALGIKLETIPQPDKWGEVFLTPEIAIRIGVDFLYIKSGSPTFSKQKTNPDGSVTDEWGITRKKVFFKNGIYYWEMVEHPLKDASIKDLEEYIWPDPDDPGRYENLLERAKDLYENTDFCLIGRFGGSIFETAWYMRGLEQWLIDLVKNQEFTRILLDKICNIQMKIDQNCLIIAGKYIQILKVAGDDLGAQECPLISPKTFEKIVKPVLCKRWKAAKDTFRIYNPEGHILFHSCGNIYPFINDFINCGLDILDPIQKVEGMEIAKLKSEFGDRLTFHGAIDTQELLPYGTAEQVKEEVRKTIQVLGRNGGYIIAPVHNVQADVPPENLIALSEAVKEYGTYPLT
jgi:uroporphyrinogen decarboxylase